MQTQQHLRHEIRRKKGTSQKVSPLEALSMEVLGREIGKQTNRMLHPCNSQS